jgi:GTP-binding protein HflX
VEAFKATLEETRLADLIVHVVDASEPPARRAAAVAAVEEVLGEIGAGATPRIVAFNKIDLVDPIDARELVVGRRDAAAISAATGAGLDELRDLIEASFASRLREVELLVPYSEGGRLAELHDVAGELERSARPDGVLVRAQVPAAVLHRFAEFAVDGDGATRGE